MTTKETNTDSDLARKLRVLIVEDEPRLRDLLVEMLPKMHYPPPAPAAPKTPAASWKPTPTTS